MDTATKVKSVSEAIGAGFMAPNEGRQKFDLPPVQGGDSPYLQQQNYSLAALDKRDNSANPMAAPGAPAAAGAEETDQADGDDDSDGDEARAFLVADILRRSQPHYVPNP